MKEPKTMCPPITSMKAPLGSEDILPSGHPGTTRSSCSMTLSPTGGRSTQPPPRETRGPAASRPAGARGGSPRRPSAAPWAGQKSQSSISSS
eukprot:jgi/Botrbrau1/19520/Bobra.0035s0019.1